MGNLVNAIFENLVSSPPEAAGLAACSALAIGLGLLLRRLRPGSWIFDWVIWTYVATGLTFALLASGMIIEEHWVRFYFGSNPIALFAGGTVIDSIMAVTWPVFVVAGLSTLDSGRRSVLEDLSVVLGPLAIGMAIAAAITIAIHGPRRRRDRSQVLGDQA